MQTWADGSDWRALLAQLDDQERQGVWRVQWTTANDDLVCAFCRAQEGRVLTIPEARVEVAFGVPTDRSHHCRCRFIPTADQG